jgi:hypothetical protein
MRSRSLLSCDHHSRPYTAQFIAGMQHLAFHHEFQIAAVFYEQSGEPAVRDDYSMSRSRQQQETESNHPRDYTFRGSCEFTESYRWQYTRPVKTNPYKVDSRVRVQRK